MRKDIRQFDAATAEGIVEQLRYGVHHLIACACSRL